MATFRNRHGKWQARVRRKGQQPVTKSFQSKQDAEKWARQLESEMDKGSYTNLVLAERTTFSEVIERYVEEVTSKSRGKLEHTYRLKALARHPISKLRMTALTPIKVAEYRDERAKTRYLTDIGNYCDMFYKKIKTRGRPPTGYTQLDLTDLEQLALAIVKTQSSK